MKTEKALQWLQCIFLLSVVHSSYQVDVCTDIQNGNAQKYSLFLIKACAAGTANNELQAANCPDVSCNGRECLFGFAKDLYGCTTCDCASDGNEGLFEADVVLTNEVEKMLRRNLDHHDKIRSKRGLSPMKALYAALKAQRRRDRSCRDESREFCQYQASIGFCTRYSQSMRRTCCMSCRSGQARTSAEPTGQRPGSWTMEWRNGEQIKTEIGTNTATSTGGTGVEVTGLRPTNNGIKIVTNTVTRTGKISCEDQNRICEPLWRKGACTQIPPHLTPDCCNSCQATTTRTRASARPGSFPTIKTEIGTGTATATGTRG